ncbi:MAG: hypothetical protein ACYC4R_01020 [Anaerolineae bacterium]
MMAVLELRIPSVPIPDTVAQAGEEPEGISFDVTPSHGQHACLVSIASTQAHMFGWMGTPFRLQEGHTGTYRPGLAFEWRVVAQRNDSTFATEDAENNLVLYAAVAPYTPTADEPTSLASTPNVSQTLFSGPVTSGMDTGNVTAVFDLAYLADQDLMFTINWDSRDNTDQDVYVQLDNVRIVNYPSPQRTDVSVIVYGGWNGLPVDAWVGGTAQPRMTTAINGYGEQQAMWSFWPEPGASWQVSTQPALPAGLDPAQWEYRLVRVDCPTMGWSSNSPGSASVQILPGQQYVVTYQLVHKG